MFNQMFHKCEKVDIWEASDADADANNCRSLFEMLGLQQLCIGYRKVTSRNKGEFFWTIALSVKFHPLANVKCVDDSST